VAKYEFALSKKPSVSETEAGTSEQISAEFFLGNAWADLGDLDRAQQHYERALELNPRDAKCETNLAGILVQRGLRSEARHRYEHSLSINPHLQIAHKELADLLCGQGEYNEAITHYEEALRIQPDYKQAQQNLAFARTLLGH